MKTYIDVDSYIADFNDEVQEVLEKIRSTIKKTIPNAKEVISYGIPTYKLQKSVVHFAAYKSHIGFYPGSGPIEHFKTKLKKYHTSKGTVQFPINEPIPYELIVEMTKFSAKQLELEKTSK